MRPALATLLTALALACPVGVAALACAFGGTVAVWCALHLALMNVWQFFRRLDLEARVAHLDRGEG